MMVDGDESRIKRRTLVLASASRRRYKLLTQIGFSPDVVMPSGIDEASLFRETPQQLVTRLAAAKTEKVFKSHPDSVTIGADTVVAVGGRAIGKPTNLEQAASTLKMLSGRRHRVYSSVCVLGGGRQRHRSVVTYVKFKRLEEKEIYNYLDCGEWKGKAGAYAIQGRASAFTISIVGSYSNVVGLPLYETYLLLNSFGVQTSSTSPSDC